MFGVLVWHLWLVRVWLVSQSLCGWEFDHWSVCGQDWFNWMWNIGCFDSPDEFLALMVFSSGEEQEVFG
jgi:hypothetical protein